MVGRALALADAGGLDALTIRRLAQELGVTPMALYWHFRSKDELLVGLATRSGARSTSRSTPLRPGLTSSGACWSRWSGCCARTRRRPSWC